jgi:hypothetical protein
MNPSQVFDSFLDEEALSRVALLRESVMLCKELREDPSQVFSRDDIEALLTFTEELAREAVATELLAAFSRVVPPTAERGPSGGVSLSSLLPRGAGRRGPGRPKRHADDTRAELVKIIDEEKERSNTTSDREAIRALETRYFPGQRASRLRRRVDEVAKMLSRYRKEIAG